MNQENIRNFVIMGKLKHKNIMRLAAEITQRNNNGSE